MSLDQLLDELKKLSKVEKLRAMQVLVTELTKEELIIDSNHEYELVTPYGNEAGAQVLMDFLQTGESE